MLLRDANTKIQRVNLVAAALAVCVTAGFAGTAHGSTGSTDVTISTAPTRNMALNNGVYSPKGANPVLNINDLLSALIAGNLKVTTGTQRGDIDISASFHWVSANALTLDASHSIRVDQPVTDAGTGALTLTTNDGGANGHLEFGASGNITFWGLANALTINGKAYTLVNSVASLAAAVTTNPAGNYALAASYDASVDHTYRQDPIAPVFGGNFEGLGNAISNVSIHMASGDIGFFDTIDVGASVSNFRLKNITIVESKSGSADVGGLASQSNGTLYGDEVSGTVSAYMSSSLGGLIGTGSGNIDHCSSSVAVMAGRYGPLAGGGLAGGFNGTIIDSFATGEVSGGLLSHSLGGLVGSSTGPIIHSHATGDISGKYLSGQGPVGGLVGSTGQLIADSYATGNVNVAGGSVIEGGLAGETDSSIIRSFATGIVNSKNRLRSYVDGGLVGMIKNASSVTDSYAIGAVAGNAMSFTGGLVALPANTTDSISNSYATGKIIDGDQGGGFGCGIVPSEVTNDYWDTTTSGTTYGVCQNTNVSGVTGLTTTQLRAGLPAGFDPKIWAQDRKINRGFPYLIANPPPQ